MNRQDIIVRLLEDEAELCARGVAHAAQRRAAHAGLNLLA